MLTSLTLKNFALIDHHDLSLAAGFNVITGETGAGKSLLLDALSLCIGGRADSSMVRHGTESADIYAQFEFNTAIEATHATGLRQNHPDDDGLATGLPPAISSWFVEHERPCEPDILIRRQLSSNGRSKAWLNGTPVSLTELKELGALLVNIHSQHAQQALLKPLFVVDWLDEIGELQDLAAVTAQAYQAYQKLNRQAKSIAEQEAQRADKIELLQNQLTDIAPLLLVDYGQVEAEHDELSNLEALMLEASLAVQLLDNDSDEPAAMELLGRAIRLCDNQAAVSPTFAQAAESLYLAQQHISEATAALVDYAEQQLPDPERLQELDTLIGLGHRLSRKHGLPAVELVDEAKNWQDTLDGLLNLPTAVTLQAQMSAAWDTYMAQATALSKARQGIAPAISEKLVAQLQPLALPNAQANFVFNKRQEAQYNTQGLDDIELMFSANVGMPMQPLYKIASGGELSRMALVMQVLLATKSNPSNQGAGCDMGMQAATDPIKRSDTDADTINATGQPMLVFDEVDVGISGGTAQVLGELLRRLGQHRQVLAITHQAQVAAQAHRHILVYKTHDTAEGQTTSQLSVLTEATQIDELARMSGGVNITDITREHARSLLADISKK